MRLWYYNLYLYAFWQLGVYSQSFNGQQVKWLRVWPRKRKVMSTINLTEILIANSMGVLMMFILLISKAWKIRGNKYESGMLLIMILFTFMSNIADAISFICDGKPGTLCFLGVFMGNTLIFISGVVLSAIWLVLVNRHINGEMSRGNKCVANVVGIFGLALCVVNLFWPVIFSVDQNNVYHRGPLCIFFILLQAVYYVDGIFIYIRAKRRGGVLKFFPVVSFLLPLYIGLMIQNMFYGVSLVYPSTSVSICGMILIFHNESIFRDPLTGLYNRYYLDNLKEEAKNPLLYHMTLIMMDMNQFKLINDKYGHTEGDTALNTVAGILLHQSGSMGVAVRFAGDEFLILLNSYDHNVVERVITGIREELAEYNRKSQKPYSLSLSVGYSEINLAEQSVAEIMKAADHQMYLDKKKFYEENPGLERRKDAEEVLS